MTSRYRLFFALYPPQRVRDKVRAELRSLHLMQARKVKPVNFHLTLSFLGMVEEQAMPCLCSAAREVAFEPFSLVLDQLGSFSRAGVLWLGPSSVPGSLKYLQERLEMRLSECGFEPEGRPYRPHMTLARKFRGHIPEKALQPVAWQVDGFQLMLSDSTQEGVRYLPLAIFPH